MAAAAPVMWYLMHEYQAASASGPSSIPSRIRSEPAITSFNPRLPSVPVGCTGRGWLNGTQSQLEFLPERSTDFVFAVFGEEFGFLGVVLLLAAYMFVVVRGLQLAARTPRRTFGRLLGGSLVLVFFVYIMINVGMVCGLLPVVGLPLR